MQSDGLFRVKSARSALLRVGRVVVALRHAVGLFDPTDESFEEIVAIETRFGKDTRLNDGKVGPDGAFWVGSMDDRAVPVKEPLGTLYRVTADGKVEAKVKRPHDIERPRILAGRTFDVPFRTLAEGGSTAGTSIRQPAPSPTGSASPISTRRPGRPDGGATDAKGDYWSAGISAQRLNRFAPDGRLLETYPVPVGAPTMPCFGGPGLENTIRHQLAVGTGAPNCSPNIR